MIRTLREFINLFKKKKQYCSYEHVEDYTENPGNKDGVEEFIVTCTIKTGTPETISSSTAITSNVDFELFEVNQFLTKRFLERQ